MLIRFSLFFLLIVHPFFLNSQTAEFIGENDDLITSERDIKLEEKGLIKFIKNLLKNKNNHKLSFIQDKNLQTVKDFLKYPNSGKIFMSKTITQIQDLKETTVKLWIIGKKLSAKIYISIIKEANNWTIKEINIIYI